MALATKISQTSGVKMKQSELKLNVMAFIGFAGMLDKMKPGTEEHLAVQHEISMMLENVWQSGYDKGVENGRKGKP